VRASKATDCRPGSPLEASPFHGKRLALEHCFDPRDTHIGIIRRQSFRERLNGRII